VKDGAAMAVAPCEVSMALWADASTVLRERPAGWAVDDEENEVQGLKGRSTMLFEEVDEEKQEEKDAKTAKGDGRVPLDEDTKRLFDVAACLLLAKRDSDEYHDKDDEDPPSYCLLEECLWKDLATIAWSYAHIGLTSSRIIRAISAEATSRLLALCAADKGKDRDLNHARPLPRDVATLCWSLSTLQADCGLLHAAADALLRAASLYLRRSPVRAPNLRHWTSEDLVQLASALAHARRDDMSLLVPLYEEAVSRIKTLSSHEISVLLWSQARLYLGGRRRGGDEEVADDPSAPAVFATFPVRASWEILSRLRCHGETALGPQERANVAWSLTVLEAYAVPEGEDTATPLLCRIFEDAARDPPSALRPEHAHQLWQAAFLLGSGDGPGCLPPASPARTALEERLAESWAREKGRRKISSQRHKALSETLDGMGVRHCNEHAEDIDVAIVLDQGCGWTQFATVDEGEDGDGDAAEERRELRHRVAVEFDGPDHFTVPEEGRGGPRALGHTVLKYRMLRRQGWAVVRVPYYEFDKIPYWASMERRRYLQRLLRTHESICFSECDVSEYIAMVPNRKSRFD